MLPMYEYCCQHLVTGGVIKLWASDAKMAEATALRLFGCADRLVRVWREA